VRCDAYFDEVAGDHIVSGEVRVVIPIVDIEIEVYVSLI